MSMRTLTEIAAELYAAPPASFIERRNAAAQAEPDPARAKQIRALRKPSVAAWVVNLFAAERADLLGQALTLANELREAQADLDAAALSALGRERRTLTQRLAEQAAELAEARGEKVTSSTLESVRQTLSAAFFDPAAAAAVASGRLVRELEPSAVLPPDLDGIVGGGAAETPPAAAPQIDELKARRERRDAERALHDAEKQLARAERLRDAAERAHREGEERREQLSRRVRELEEELERAESSLNSTEAAILEAERRRDESVERVDEASRAVSTAREALEALRT